MFWKKKTKFDWGLVLFGLIAIVIILTTALLVLELVSKFDQLNKEQKNIANSQIIKNLYEDLIKVDENYNKDISKLISVIDTETSLDNLFSVVEEAFFKVRVSENKKDLHLQALLQIVDLKKSNQDLSEVKIKIKEVLNSLITKDIN